MSKLKWEPSEYDGWTTTVGPLILNVTSDPTGWSVQWLIDDSICGIAPIAEAAKARAIEAAQELLHDALETLGGTDNVKG
jgi:hypothetical protein